MQVLYDRLDIMKRQKKAAASERAVTFSGGYSVSLRPVPTYVSAMMAAKHQQPLRPVPFRPVLNDPTRRVIK
jgi:hypothetical protein